MIYLITGTDSAKVRARVHEVLESLIKKRPDAVRIRLTPETYTSSALTELIGAQGLFSPKLIVELDGVAGLTDSGIEAQGVIEGMEQSDNVFLIIEESLEKTILDPLKFAAYKAEEFNTVESERMDTSMFVLADALGARDKKKLWVEYQRALKKGGVPEEIHGMLFWQVKSMLLAALCTEKDSGLKPFVYKKSKKYAANYTEKELRTLSSNLVTIYHEARRSGPDLATALEQWILSL